MASSMISSATVATVSRASPARASMVSPFTGLKSGSAFPVTRKSVDITTLASNGGKVRCMKVWPTEGLKKFETLSYLPDLTQEQLIKQIAYLLRKGWIACVEFQLREGFIFRKYHSSPGYYDGRYWTMWKLPMYGCTDPLQIIKELEEAKKAYPNAFIRIIGFDNVRQVQCISFIVFKPPGIYESDLPKQSSLSYSIPNENKNSNQSFRQMVITNA